MTKNEPDYRLFLVHILHTLEKLDDRPVRDNEKQTAKIHFDQNKKWSHYRDVQARLSAVEIDRFIDFQKDRE